MPLEIYLARCRSCDELKEIKNSASLEGLELMTCGLKKLENHNVL